MTGGINVYASFDAGINLNKVSHWVFPNNVGYVHADIHELVYNPLNGVLYTGTDGGISYSVDNGANWINIWDGLTIMQFYRIDGVEANQDLLLGGTQDNGTNIYSGSFDYEHIFGADGMDCKIDYNNNQNLLFSY